MFNQKTHDGTYAMQLRLPIRYADISNEVDAGPATQSALNSTQIWCEEAYFSCDERLPVEPGTHLLVYTPEEGGHGEETHEEEAATSDELMDLPDDRSSTLPRRSWTLWIIAVSWTATAISTSPHEWHCSLTSMALQGMVYFALLPFNWQSHVSDRWCSVNLRMGGANQNGTMEDSVWPNDTQSVDQWDYPNVDFSCSTPIDTRALLGMTRPWYQPCLVGADMIQYVDLLCPKQHHMVDPVMDMDSQEDHLVPIPNGMPLSGLLSVLWGTLGQLGI